MSAAKKGAPNDGHQTFWTLAAPLLALEGVERSTMMGFPCLRCSGRYFASIDKDGTGLIVKLSRARVQALIAEGIGAPFSPAGRVFREWVFVAMEHEDSWAALLAEAHAFSVEP